MAACRRPCEPGLAAWLRAQEHCAGPGGSVTKCLHRAYYRAMRDDDQLELKRRLAMLAPFFRDLGARTLETYAAAGVMAAIPDNYFPVSDAVCHRDDAGFACNPHGAVYFSVSREGELQLAVQGAGVPITEAISEFSQLARLEDLEATGPMEGATEWFPPPRFLLDPDTHRLYIAAVAGVKRSDPRTLFVPVEQYIEERAKLFTEAFLAAPRIPE